MLDALSVGQWIVVWMGVWACVSLGFLVYIYFIDGPEYAPLAALGAILLGAMGTVILFAIWLFLCVLVFLWTV